jgi:hypothetical protein
MTACARVIQGPSLACREGIVVFGGSFLPIPGSSRAPRGGRASAACRR